MPDARIYYMIVAVIIILVIIIAIVLAMRWKHRSHHTVFRILSTANGATLQWNTGAWVLAKDPGVGNFVTLGPGGEIFDYPSGYALVLPTQNGGESRVGMLPSQPGQIHLVFDAKTSLIRVVPNEGNAIAGNAKPVPILYDASVLDNKWTLVSASLLHYPESS